MWLSYQGGNGEVQQQVYNVRVRLKDKGCCGILFVLLLSAVFSGPVREVVVVVEVEVEVVGVTLGAEEGPRLRGTAARALLTIAAAAGTAVEHFLSKLCDVSVFFIVAL